MTIAVVTDSSAQLSAEQIDAHGVRVVPISIVLDDVPYRDGVDLEVDDFYGRLGAGVRVSTAQPSPGAFVEAWSAAVEAGATEIVSVHVGSELSGTLNSARLAAGELHVPIHLIDSKLTSYGLGQLTLAIVDRVRTLGSTDGIGPFAADVVESMSMVFILQDLKYVLRGGRMRRAELPSGANDIPVLGGSGGAYQLLGTGRTIDELVEQMAAALLEGEHQRHVAIALAAPDTIEFTEKLEARMHESALVESVHRYRMGPAVAVHTGPGTAGGFAWPA